MRTLAPTRAPTDAAGPSARSARSPQPAAPAYAPFVPDTRTLTAPSVLALQQGAGNAAVAGVLGAPARATGGCGPDCGCADCGQKAGKHDHEHETTDGAPGAGGACTSCAPAPAAATSRAPDGVVVRDTAAPAPAARAGCGVAAIGAPAGCTPAVGDAVGDRVLFKRNCDEFLNADEEEKVAAFADSMIDTDRVLVHGFASVDGQLEYNDNLSCARALTVVGVLMANGIAAGRIEVFRHGEMPGDPVSRRSVVLERVPPVSRPTVPQLTAAVVTPPTPGICGGMLYVVEWHLSRNAGAQGGYVLQDITIAWNVVDCDGNPTPKNYPWPNPLHYYEAWRVAPNSTNLSPVTTDTFEWFNPGPLAGGCTTGTVSFFGVARYHDNVAALPPDMTAFNNATWAGQLQSSTNDPALGGNQSNPLVHRLTFHWQCCPCSSSPTVVDDSAP